MRYNLAKLKDYQDKMKDYQEKTIRHPKKEPENIREEDKIDFKSFLNAIDIDSSRYEEILKKLILNTKRDKKIYHINKNLGAADYQHMQKIIYTLASFGFQFTDIEYLFSNLLGRGKSGKWAKNYSEVIEKEDYFLQKPVQVYILLDEYGEIEKLWNANEGEEDKLQTLVDKVMEQKLVLAHIPTNKILTVQEALLLEKVDRRK